MIIPHQLPRRSLLSIIGVLTSLASIYTLFHLWSSSAPALYSSLPIPNSFATVQDDYPFNKDLDDGDFGELGLRVQVLSGYYAKADSQHKNNGASALLLEVEAATLKLFPWLRTSGTFDPTPLKTLRKSYRKRGIVIPVGKSQFRFAAHLITALRSVLNSELDIAIAYAGDADLPLEYRTALTSLDPTMAMLDISKILNEEIIQVAGSWSIKP
jgi:alpha 1,3-mannosyltransferase